MTMPSSHPVRPVLAPRTSASETLAETAPTLGTSDGDGADSRPAEAGEIVPRDIASETLSIRDLEAMLRARGCSNRKAKAGASAAFNAMRSASDAPADPPPAEISADQFLHNALARLRGR